MDGSTKITSWMQIPSRSRKDRFSDMTSKSARICQTIRGKPYPTETRTKTSFPELRNDSLQSKPYSYTSDSFLKYLASLEKKEPSRSKFFSHSENLREEWKSSNLSLVEAGILDGAVRFVERLKGVAHVPVPQPGLLLIRDAEQLPHFLLNHIYKHISKKMQLTLCCFKKTNKKKKRHDTHVHKQNVK